jgi:hypothetical protein
MGKIEKAILQLPLIGPIDDIICLNALNKTIQVSQKEDHKNIEQFQKTLGDYLWESESKEYKHILDILFPNKEKLDVENTIKNGNSIAPLFTKIFAKINGVLPRGCDNRHPEKYLSSAWSYLMLELGEFKLDERFSDLRYDVEGMIHYICTSGDPPEHPVLYALFEEKNELLEEIWDRIVGDDMLPIFVDDDDEFDKKLGIRKTNGNLNNDTPSGDRVRDDMHWIMPRLKNNQLVSSNNKTVIEEIKFIKNNSPKFPVLIIDLLFRDQDDINKIQGDNLIKSLRGELGDEVLIMGFTGGKSPFIINSAVKAGADIVIQKERGANVETDNPHGLGNPGGLFDLLWALSQNINRWRFLEAYKCLIRKNEFTRADRGFDYYPVLDKLFYSIENESPFWRKYLNVWLQAVGDHRVKSILFDHRDQ